MFHIGFVFLEGGITRPGTWSTPSSPACSMISAKGPYIIGHLFLSIVPSIFSNEFLLDVKQLSYVESLY
jgi:hypothetical protein